MDPIARPPEGSPPPPTPLPRRAFLRIAAWAGLLVGSAAVTAKLTRGGTVAAGSTATSPVASPTPPQPLPAAHEALAGIPPDPPQVAQGLSPLFTPTADFYRIDVAMEVPTVNVDSWQLTIDGDVTSPLTLRYDQLLGMDLVEVDATLSCVSNPVGGYEIGTARWTGVRLRELLDRVGVSPNVEQVFSYGAEGFTAGFPIEYAGHPDAVVAVGMNGEPLTTEHGFPARLVVPGLFGYVSATKWLGRIELTTWAKRSGYWIPRGWSRLGPMKPGSRFDIPRQGATLPAGRVTVAGMAWSATGVSRVEVREGSGRWQRATLGHALPGAAWRQWWTTMDLPTGRSTLTARCYDGSGEVQTDQVADVVPDGATGWPSVVVDVT